VQPEPERKCKNIYFEPAWFGTAVSAATLFPRGCISLRRSAAAFNALVLIRRCIVARG
jgi:hypothetical protein